MKRIIKPHYLKQRHISDNRVLFLLLTVSLVTVDTGPDLRVSASQVFPFVLADIYPSDPDTVVVGLVDSDVPLSSFRSEQK